jgi:hypothetical protein
MGGWAAILPMGTRIPPTWPIMRQTSGGGWPPCFSDSRAANLITSVRGYMFAKSKHLLPIPEGLRGKCRNHPSNNAHKSQASHLQIETVAVVENYCKRLKCQEKDTENQCGPAGILSR